MKILLVGGSKSGKSGLAQRLCVRLAAGAPMIYWATMEPVDGEEREQNLSEQRNKGRKI